MNQNSCKLCLKPKELRESHILSEYEYKPLYDDKHRFYRLSSKKTKPDILQKGLREKLLCNECEKLRSKCERYASLVINGGVELGGEPFPGGIKVTGVDYNKFKLHQLFNLWIASISTLPEFSAIRLHESINEKLRFKLLSEDPGHPREYPCFVCGLISKNKGPIQQIILPPTLIEKEGIQWARFVIGSFVWTYCISENLQSEFPDDLFINREGELIIHCVHPSNVNFLTETLFHVLEPKLTDYPSRNKADLKKFVEIDLWEK